MTELLSKLSIQRHCTAINRSGLSRPFQYLALHGFLDGEARVFDYGCGAPLSSDNSLVFSCVANYFVIHEKKKEN